MTRADFQSLGTWEVERSGKESVVFSMPNKNSDLARERKRVWYQKNKDLILKRKRERHASQKKQRPPRPKPPAPTPEQIARTRALNKEACQRYRATHLAQVRFINRVYYHKNRERIVQQQRNRRVARKIHSGNYVRWPTCAWSYCTS